MVPRRRRRRGSPSSVTTAISFGLIYFVSRDPENDVVAALGGTTALLLLGRVRDRERRACSCCAGTPIDRKHFVRADRAADHRRDRLRRSSSGHGPAATPIQYQIAGWLLGIGLILWILMWITNRLLGQRSAITDLEALNEPEGGVN